MSALDALPAAGEGAPAAPPPDPSLSRVVLSAQEDLRRDIARAMHDGPAQSLTNIVLQAAIVERLMDREPESAKGELRLLVSMVQQTLDATKTFIFDVRPMVLDDLGLVPTLRRMTRDRGRRAKIPVEFDSLGQDRRLPMDLESTIFRILDEALAAYLALQPDRAHVTAGLDRRARGARDRRADARRRRPTSRCRRCPTGDVPDAIKAMIQDRHDARTGGRAGRGAGGDRGAARRPRCATSRIEPPRSAAGSSCWAAAARSASLVPLPRETPATTGGGAIRT